MPMKYIFSFFLLFPLALNAMKNEPASTIPATNSRKPFGPILIADIVDIDNKPYPNIYLLSSDDFMTRQIGVSRIVKSKFNSWNDTTQTAEIRYEVFDHSTKLSIEGAATIPYDTALRRKLDAYATLKLTVYTDINALHPIKEIMYQEINNDK